MDNFDAKILKSLIKERGYRVNWVAGRLGVTPSTLSGYMCGSRQPSKPVVILMAQLFETDEKSFFKKGRAS